MSSIEFGNRLFELRKKNNLTQRYVAYQLDVTDKAVSKWERGESKPDIDKLNLLASMYNVSFDELLELQNKKNVSINKIVLTGGPCAGKTTALSWINNYFSQRGYKVLTISEGATNLITSGITPWDCEDFQEANFKSQKFNEQLFENVAKNMNAGKVLIICDRGVIDSKAYMKESRFTKLLRDFGTNEIKERDSYDAVFHLVTAAKGKEEAYTLANNQARTEGIKEASEIDDKIINAWTGHPHFRIIDNSTDFEGKLERLLKEMALFLGEPEPFEIERKFLIYYPNIKELENMPNCTKVDIVQTYLKSIDGSERRVRARGIDGNYVYFLTEKRKVSSIKRVEIEKQITQDEYLKLLMEADSKLHTIHKTRYCLSENNQYFEIDIYPDWDTQAIMEIELSSEEEEIKLPKCIKVFKEVTDDESYKNYEMAKKTPKVLIKNKRG